MTIDVSPHTAEEAALWQRLAAHTFGPPDAAFDFTTRLAREQGWSRADAAAALDEYRRYCFLAVRAGHVVTPSPAVDQVWHLHLTCTRDYWDVFCPQVLGRTLHHEPTRGGAQEAAKHGAQYAATLESYARYFGPPPERWWPDAHAALYRGDRQRWVDLDEHWLLLRPRWPGRRLRMAAAALLFGLCVAPVAVALDLPANPFDWTGPSFLMLYLILLVAGAIAGRLWQRRLRDNGREPGSAALAPYEAAYLAGGTQRVADAAVAELMQRDVIHWDAAKRQFNAYVRKDSLPPPLDAVHASIRSNGQPRHIARGIDASLAGLRSALMARGLLLDGAGQARARWTPLLIDAALLGFAGIKIAVGHARGKPVALLVVLAVATVVFALIKLARRVEVSLAGERALDRLRTSKAHVVRAPQEKDLPFAVALGGTAVLATTAYAYYHQARAAAPSGCSSGSSCSSSGGDGGGGGCGGCGGGGGD